MGFLFEKRTELTRLGQPFRGIKQAEREEYRDKWIEAWERPWIGTRGI